MKSKNLVLMVVAIGCGLVAALLTAKLGAKGSVDTVAVVVAKAGLPQGTQLKEDQAAVQLEVKQFPKDVLPPDGFIRPEEARELYGKRLKRTLRQGDHFTREDLVEKFSIEIPEGHRAMAIKVTADSIAGGFVLPGTRVDVVATPRRQQDGKVVSKMLLQNVLVAAVDNNPTVIDNQASVATANTATLAVTPDQALTLGLAAEGGNLRLLLRNKGDESVVKLSDRMSIAGEKGEDGQGGPAVATVKIPVAREDIPANTKIDDPAKFFEEMEFMASAQPRSAVRSLSDLKGKYITAPVAQQQFVPDNYLSEKANAPGQPAEVRPARKVEVTRVLVQNGQDYHYAEYRDGVRTDGKTTPGALVQPAKQPETDAPVAPADRKPEGERAESRPAT